MVIFETILGIFGKAVVSQLGSGYNYIKSSIQRDNAILQLAERTTSAIETIIPTKTEEVEDFLLSQEVDNIIKQIFSTHILPTDRSDLLTQIREEFNILLRIHVDLNDDEYQKISPILFDTLIDTCICIYEENIKKDVPYLSKERLGNLRFTLLQDQITNLHNNIDFLKREKSPDIQDYLIFETNYRRQVIDRYQYIRPIHLDEAYKISIDSLYVAPNLVKSSDNKRSDQIEISNSEFINSINRCVVLGDPGAGKTTLSKKICYDFARGLSKREYGLNDFTPIFIELKEYGIKLEYEGLSIIEYIELVSSSLLQEPILAGAFDYLLMNGRAFVIFDGLDELLDTSKRRVISDNIESFCNRYPTTPILVTSRKVGYEQAPLSSDRFETYYISNLNHAQIKEYVTKWFSQNTDLIGDDQNKKVISFLRESHNVSELRSNPLILSLMCDLYRGEGYIPTSRPDVYERCSELLFKKWDKIRGIKNKVPFEAHTKPTLMYIAFQIYSNEKYSSGIPEQQLIKITIDYLFPKKYSDIDVATEIAKEFIDFCRGRAWVFTEIGSTGHNLYQFTHRTFLEYFTAFHLARNYSSPEELNNFLLPKILKQEWDVVAQLSYQILNTNVADAGDNLVGILLSNINGDNFPSKFNLASFIVRCLEFIVFSPETIRKIIENCFSLSIELSQISKFNNSFYEKGITIDELINPLFVSDVENIPSIKKSIIDISNKIIANRDSDIASKGLHIISAMPSFKQFLESKGKINVSFKFRADELVFDIITANEWKIQELSSINWKNAEIAYNYDIISIEDLIKIYGAGVLFSINILHGVDPPFFSSLIDRFFAKFVAAVNDDKNNFVLMQKELLKIFTIINDCPLPWNYYPAKTIHVFPSKNIAEYFEIIESRNNPEKRNLDFHFFLMLAPLVEHELLVYSHFNEMEIPNQWDKKELFENIINMQTGYLDPILFIFRAKILGFNSDEVEDLLAAVFSSEEDRCLIFSWIRDEVKFLNPIFN